MEKLQFQNITSGLGLQMLVFDPGGELIFSSWNADDIALEKPRNLESLVSLPGATAAASANLRDYLADTSQKEFECDFEHFTGKSPRHFRLSAVRISDEPRSVLAVHIQDVSREYGLLRELETLERQASAGQMAAGVAHEFNNILTAMMGWTQLASRTVNGNAAAQMALSTIDNNTRRARKIAGELLEITSPTKSVETQMLQVGDVVKDALKLLTWDLTNHHVGVIEEIYETQLCKANATRLVQVFVNVIRNAMDAMRDSRGTLGVRVVQSGEQVVTTITDNGPGITDDALEKVFQPFFTTKSRDDGTFGGSGLGLSVSRRIIEEFGGSIHIERSGDPNGGTVVTIVLPSQEDDRDTIEDDPGRSSTFPPGAAVLVVDDEPDICEMIRMALNLRGTHVVSATCGEDAVALCEKETFDAVFLDFSMSGLSGYDLRDAISATQPELPIVFMSGVDIPNLEKDADFLKKPFDLHDIQVKLREVLER